MFSKHHPALLGLFIVILATTCPDILLAQANINGTCQYNRKAIVRNEAGSKKAVYSLEAHIAIPVDDTPSADDTFSLARRCLTDFDSDPAKRRALRQLFVKALLLEKPPKCPPTLFAEADKNGLEAALEDFVANESSHWIVRALIDKNDDGTIHYIELSAEIEICTASDGIHVAAVSCIWETIETLLKTPKGLADLKDPLKQEIKNRMNQQAPGAAKFFGL